MVQGKLSQHFAFCRYFLTVVFAMEAQGRVFQGVISILDDRREYRAYLTRMFPRSESEKARNRPIVLLANNECGNVAGPKLPAPAHLPIVTLVTVSVEQNLASSRKEPPGILVGQTLKITPQGFGFACT